MPECLYRQMRVLIKLQQLTRLSANWLFVVIVRLNVQSSVSCLTKLGLNEYLQPPKKVAKSSENFLPSKTADTRTPSLTVHEHLMSSIVKALHDFTVSRASLLASSLHPSITACNIMDKLLFLPLPPSTPLFSKNASSRSESMWACEKLNSPN